MQRLRNKPASVEQLVNQRGVIINEFLPEPIGSPLVRVLFTNVHSVVAVDALEVKARAAELGQHQQIKHFGVEEGSSHPFGSSRLRS